MNLPAIGIVKAAVKTNADLVWEAMNRGPGTFSRKCCAIDPNATHETPATHYMMQDMGATDTDVAEWQAMTNGDLPQIAGVWGEDGVISAQDAQAAVSNGNLMVFSAAGLVTSQDATDWRDGTFAGVGLQFVPDEPI